MSWGTYLTDLLQLELIRIGSFAFEGGSNLFDLNTSDLNDTVFIMESMCCMSIHYQICLPWNAFHLEVTIAYLSLWLWSWWVCCSYKEWIIDIGAFECEYWPKGLFQGACDVTIESERWIVLWIVDAPGWEEHISVNNSTLCFNNSQPFNPSSLSSTITHLDCCAHCGNGEDMEELCLKEYPCLESIHIGSYSFPHIQSVKVNHLPQLKQFAVEDHCFLYPINVNLGVPCRVEDCPLLESISIGTGSFFQYSALLLKSNEMNWALNARSPPSEVVVCGNWNSV